MQRVKRMVARGAKPVAILALILCGLYAVKEALNVGVALGVGAAVLLALWRPSWRGATIVVLRVLGATLVAFLAMVGVAVLLNLLVDLLHHLHPLRHLKLPIAVGLLIAMEAFALAAYWYLRRAGWEIGRSALVAVELAALAVLVTPYVVGRVTEDHGQVAEAHPVPGELDVYIVTDGSRHRPQMEPPPSPALAEFDVNYSVGYAVGDGVRWTLLDGERPAAALGAIAEGRSRPPVPGAPASRPEADHVLLLYVDGTPPVLAGDTTQLPNVPALPGEVERWGQLAHGVAAQTDPALPTFALLQTTAKRRLAAWKGFAPPNGPVSVQALGSLTATDAAVRLAIAAPTAQQDLALAMQYRPVLLFDRRETAPRPLSIAALFNERRVRLCHDRGLGGTTCDPPIVDPKLLENVGTHLRLELPEAEALHRLAVEEAGQPPAREEAPAEAGPAAAATLPEGLPPTGTLARTEAEEVGSKSAIYVHPVSVSREGKELLYLDYWWYLPYNPVKLGGGALCGAGLVIAGVTCQSHQSDWEGVTVVVDRTARVPRIVAVQYAQHNKVVRYSWSLLREAWDGNREIESRIAGIGDASLRPLVFVAVGSHASYPKPCNKCRQFPNPAIPEEPHLGNLPWSGNDTEACGRSSCLQALPTHQGGRKAALWNGYDGPWGELHCFLTYYCDSGDPPKSPGNQRRYKHPTWFDGYAGTDWRFHDAPSVG
jgi:hypothetical protein